MSDGMTDTSRTLWLEQLDSSLQQIAQAMNRLSLWELDEEFMKLAHKLASAAKAGSSSTAWEDHQRNDTLTGRGLEDWIDARDDDYMKEHDNESQEG